MSGDRRGGVADYEAAMAGYRAAGNEVGALAAEHRALINSEVGDLDERRRRLEGLLERFRALGLGTGEVQVLGSLAGVEARLGGTERAAELLEEAADRAASIGFVWVERGQRDSLARLYLEYGRFGDARDQGLRALELATRAGDRLGTVYALTFFALLAARRDHNDEAGELWGALEAEAGRGPLGIWAAEERARVEASLPLADADFTRGRERGARLSLDEAVDAVLASID
jgi:tetratricopeptide (TPR) repeat protein